MNRTRWTTWLALLLVPALIAGSFLWGTAYVDAGLKSVQAAIVNNDEMVTVNGQVMPLGRQLTADLVDSGREQNVDWVLATQDKAAEGLVSGRYVAVVTIPEDFSANATSFGGDADAARKATIQVDTSPVAGLDETALGQSIAEAAANTLNRFLTGEYLKNVYVGFNDMQAQMVEMADGTAQLADGAAQLADGAGQSAEGAGQLAEGLTLASANSGQLRDGAAQSASGAGALADGLGQAAAGSQALRDGVRAATDGAGQLADGATQVADGTAAWAQGADTYADGVASYAEGAGQYAVGVSQYTEGVSDLVTPVRDAIAALPEWSEWLEQAQSSVSGLTAAAIAADARVQADVEQVRAWVRQALALAPDAEDLAAGVAAAADQAAALASGGVTCPDSLTAEACAAYQQGAAAAGSQLSDALADVDTDAASLAESTQAVQDAGATILGLLDRISAASTSLVAWAPQVQAQLEALQASIPAGTPTSKAEVLALLDQFLDGGAQLATGAQGLADGADRLTAGARQLADGARGLSAGAGQVAGGMDGLADGLGQLSTGVDAYTGGIDQAADGASQLASGLGQLSTGVDAYTGGIDQAADGASQLASGLGQLADGSEGLAGGTRELADGVAAGVDQIPTYTDSERDQLSSVVASPIDTEGLSALVRPSLAWVSLLLVTALWLGALATFAAVPAPGRRGGLSTASSASLLGRSILPGVAVTAAQAVVLAVIGAFASQLSVSAGMLLGFVLLITGVVFALVNHALAALFGAGGRIAALVMAVLTVVPAVTATAPGMFGALGGLSPLTPALEAVRAVSTGSGTVLPLLVLVGWGVIGLGGAIAAVARTRMVPLASVVHAMA